jgi:RNA polymerase sigma-70 factor (ECF subfamily)
VTLSGAIDSKAAKARLVGDATGGDRAAFGTLYEQYRRMIHGILLAYVNYSEAEDLMQEVFLQAMNKLPGLRDPAAFGGWLASIARHTAVDHHRTARKTIELHESHRRVEAGEAGWILAEIRKLPEAYREPLMLRLVEGMTGPEIAERTGLKPDSVRVNLCRGMKLLRERLGESNVE